MPAFLPWLCALLGGLGGVLLYGWFRRRVLLREREPSPADAEELEALRRTVAQTRRDTERALQEEWRAERASLERELDEETDRLDAQDARIAARARRIERLEATLELRGRRYDERKETSKALRAEVERLEAQRIEELEKRAELARADAHLERVEAFFQGLKSEHETERRDRLQRVEEEATLRARELLTVVTHRYDGESHLERISNSFTLSEAQAELLGDPSSVVAEAFREATDCELVLGGDMRSVTVRCDDPLAREATRRLLRQLLTQEPITPVLIREAGKQVRETLHREVANAGARAVKRLGLGEVHPEIVDLIGRLKFRLSFSQNQWKHSIEVSHLTGLLAAELAQAVLPAKRAGLMHDMGKALTHAREGAHAIIGAEIAERCGESEAVRHAIGAHHYDETPTTALAFLVISADAMSGARPGARRDSTTHYNDRIRDIERIAGKEPGVLRVDVMQGGREVRVIVAGSESGALPDHEREYDGVPALPDDEVYPLAQRIARAIEEEITFAGQIRVTVIRESRAVSLAS